MVDQWNLWNLSKMVSWSEAGYFWQPMSAGQSALVRENVDCTNADCPQAYMQHRYVATPEQREQMQEYVTRVLRARFEQHEIERGVREDCKELRRLHGLPDRRD